MSNERRAANGTSYDNAHAPELLSHALYNVGKARRFRGPFRPAYTRARLLAMNFTARGINHDADHGPGLGGIDLRPKTGPELAPKKVTGQREDYADYGQTRHVFRATGVCYRAGSINCGWVFTSHSSPGRIVVRLPLRSAPFDVHGMMPCQPFANALR